MEQRTAPIRVVNVCIEGCQLSRADRRRTDASSCPECGSSLYPRGEGPGAHQRPTR